MLCADVVGDRAVSHQAVVDKQLFAGMDGPDGMNEHATAGCKGLAVWDARMVQFVM